MANNEQLNTIDFGYELLRVDLIQQLLVNDERLILYYAGRTMAEKYPQQTDEHITLFFNHANWGELTLLKDKSGHRTYELTSQLISDRIARKQEVSYAIEAGFLAHTLQMNLGFTTEATFEVNKSKRKVVFTVEWDKRDPRK
ncbi:MAG: DUF2507 domain-containing protein [Bacilli bacterium]